MSRSAMTACPVSRSGVISFESYHRGTHVGPAALLGPVKWSVQEVDLASSTTDTHRDVSGVETSYSVIRIWTHVQYSAGTESMAQACTEDHDSAQFAHRLMTRSSTA